MTSNVVSLDSRRITREAVTTCPGCTPQKLCYPHRLDALAARLRATQLDRHSLLVAASDVDAMVTDALEVLDGITGECLPAHARVATPKNPNNSGRRAR